MKRLRSPLCFIACVSAGVVLIRSVATCAAETCCRRQFVLMRTGMPANQESDLNFSIETAVLGTLGEQGQGLIPGMPESSCIELEFAFIDEVIADEERADAIDEAVARQRNWPTPEPSTTRPEWHMDYVFRALLKADSVTGRSERVCEEGIEPGTQHCTGGDLEGSFTFALQLVDHHHDTVVKEGSVSWSGTIMEGFGYHREGGATASPIRQVVNGFMPLQTLIEDYERIADTAEIDLPSETVGPGETVTITLSDLFDDHGRQTQSWQRILVKVGKGRILNGKRLQGVAEGYHEFRAGGEGIVKVQYRAPAECLRQRETLTVYNTCNKTEYTGKGDDDPEAGRTSVPGTEIASKEFDIVCDRVSIDCSYLHNPDRLEDYGLQFGGNVHAEVRLTTSERTSGGYTMTQLGGEATGTQKCWVEDPPGESRIENLKCPDFTAVVVDGAVWPREYNFVLDVPDAAQLTYDIVHVPSPGSRPQRSSHRQWAPLMCMETPIHLGRELDAVYTHRRTDDANAMRYEVTARWATADN